MMDTKKAMEIAASFSKSETETPKVETEAKVENKEVEVNDVPKSTGNDGTEPKAEEVPQQPTRSETVATSVKPTEDAESSETKKQFSNQKQADYAFAKEKAKRKALQAKYDALVKEVDELRKQKPNTDNQAEYVNYLVDLKDKERETNRLQESIVESKYAEYEQLNNARIDNCFPTETERAKYRELVSQSGSSLLRKLDEADPEQAVLAYLDDSEIAPILTRLFIAEPSYLDAVLAKHSPYGRYQAMDELARKVEYARSRMNEQTKPNDATNEQPSAKKPLPVIGSVTKSDANKDTKEVFDPNAILHKLKSKNKYHK